LPRTDGRREVYRTTHDWADQEEVVSSIVDAIAVATEEDALQLPPLYGTIDPDALDDLFGPSPTTANASVRFEHGDCTVVVTNDGRISIYQ